MSERYAHIDAMRAIAALLVVWIHVSESFVSVAGGGQFLHIVARDLGLGTVGVVLFFLVSGFVIPSSLREGGDRGAELRRFAIRRFFRLYPAYWLSLILALFTTYWLWGRQVDFARILANVTMLQRLFGYEDIEGLYWTLAIELAFYILCATLFAVGLLGRERIVAGLAVLFGGIYFSDVILGLPVREGPLRVLFATDLSAYLSLMFAGALLRRWHDGMLVDPWVRGALVGLLAMFVLPPLARSGAIVEGQLSLRFPPDGGKALAVVIFVNLAIGLRLRHRVLGWLGEISYSVYLFHPVIFYGVLWLVEQPGMEWARGQNLAVYLALNFALTIGFSAAVFRWVESPMVRVGRRLTRTESPAQPALPAVA